MTSLTGVGRRGGLSGAALLLAAASLALAGCKTTGKEMAEEESTWNNPFAPKTFEEAKAMLPALPQEANLIPFSVAGTGTLSFAVDSKSISVGKDNVVRYTVVTTSQSGARNVTFEGMRCDAFERKLYATLPPGATEWVPNSSDYGETWHRMQAGVRNAYAATLATDFFCEGRTVAGKPADMVLELQSRAPHKR
ncbi:CNP1-like family protein [Cupriavidus neocaledonicus]|uniref:LIPOPROTEIN n=1 Tax=Cupriavidus neocaledonicus TaxID=1040979 RepID=A0A375HCI5_9BURK|nr:CNP1-like family protein [Cupriavidus neocaledonicus]SOZ36106.1 putative LIPOPROTEIN [Cupriavidus neocaledonicus]SPD48103.1 putative LIPOPROTEIN [Cupriavidus neocaledonicus]